jgi:hypothetical protein
MLLEATRALEDGLVRDVRDVDLALIFGIGFPPFRGGLLFWADTLGAPRKSSRNSSPIRRSASATNQRRCSPTWPERARRSSMIEPLSTEGTEMKTDWSLQID